MWIILESLVLPLCYNLAPDHSQSPNETFNGPHLDLFFCLPILLPKKSVHTVIAPFPPD